MGEISKTARFRVVRMPGQFTYTIQSKEPGRDWSYEEVALTYPGARFLVWRMRRKRGKVARVVWEEDK